MAKYIIDIPDDRVCDFVGSTHLLMPYEMAGRKGHHNTGLELTPYTGPGREAIEDEVWEFVRDIISGQNMSFFDSEKCYGFSSTNQVILNLSYREAKSKYEAWRKRKDEIRVGDEVQYSLAGYEYTFIVFGKENDVLYGMRTDKVNIDDIYETWDYCNKSDSTLKKTGRYFPEVAELLKKMRKE